MSFRQMVKQAMVDDRAVRMNDRMQAAEIIRSVGKDPLRYDLVQANPDGTIDLFPSNAIISVRDGSHFETQLTSENGID